MEDEQPETEVSNVSTRTLLNNLFFVIRVLGLYPDVVTYLADVPGGKRGDGASHLVACAQGELQLARDVYQRLLQIVGVTHEVLCLGSHDEIRGSLVESGRQLWDLQDCPAEEAPEHLAMLKRHKKALTSLTKLRKQQLERKAAVVKLEADRRKLEADRERLLALANRLAIAKQVIDAEREKEVRIEMVPSRRDRVWSPPEPVVASPPKPASRPPLPKPPPVVEKAKVMSTMAEDGEVDETTLSVRELMALRRRQR